jgi:glucose uptake protein GlcU
MINVMVMSVKVLLLGLWGLFLLSVISLSPMPPEYQGYVFPLVGIVLAAHLLEYFAMKARFKRKTNLDMNFVQTMLWGFGYWLPLFSNNTVKASA